MKMFNVITCCYFRIYCETSTNLTKLHLVLLEFNTTMLNADDCECGGDDAHDDGGVHEHGDG